MQSSATATCSSSAMHRETSLSCTAGATDRWNWSRFPEPRACSLRRRKMPSDLVSRVVLCSTLPPSLADCIRVTSSRSDLQFFCEDSAVQVLWLEWLTEFRDGWPTPSQPRISFMATKVLGPAMKPEPDQNQTEDPANTEQAKHRNLPQHADSAEQREILDALPVLVFLERAGRVVFANAEARQMLGHAEDEWTPRPMEEVLWGLFPGAAEPQTLLTGTRKGSPFHATMPAKNGRLLPVEGTYSVTNAALRESVIVAHPGGRRHAPKTRLMEDVLASIPEAVAIELGNHLLYTNPAFTRMFGYTAEEAAGESLSELIVPETRQSEHDMLAKSVNEHG